MTLLRRLAGLIVDGTRDKAAFGRRSKVGADGIPLASIMVIAVMGFLTR